MFKVIIAGGRKFDDYQKLRKYCDIILKNKENVEIVSGKALGADKLGEDYAKERGYPIRPFPAPWNETEGKPSNEIGVNRYGKKYWKLAGHHRNEQMAKYADALIAFWDGKSTGTKNMIELAKEYNLVYRVIEY